MTAVADTLYTIKTTLKDFHHDPSGALQQIQIAGTYPPLPSAKEAAKTALYTLGYSTEDLPTYDIKSPSNVESWAFGDGVLVHAVAPSKEEFIVEIETCPNVLKLHSVGKDEKVEDKLS